MDKLAQIGAVIKKTTEAREKETEIKKHLSETVSNRTLRHKQIRESNDREDTLMRNAYLEIKRIFEK